MILDNYNSKLYFENKVIHLTKFENKLMEYFIANKNKKINLKNIIYYIFNINNDYKSYSHTTRNIIYHINLKLKPYARIQTTYGRGYFLIFKPSHTFLLWKKKFFQTHKEEALLLKLYKEKEKIEKNIKTLEKNII